MTVTTPDRSVVLNTSGLPAEEGSARRHAPAEADPQGRHRASAPMEGGTGHHAGSPVAPASEAGFQSYSMFSGSRPANAVPVYRSATGHGAGARPGATGAGGPSTPRREPARAPRRTPSPGRVVRPAAVKGPGSQRPSAAPDRATTSSTPQARPVAPRSGASGASSTGSPAPDPRPATPPRREPLPPHRRPRPGGHVYPPPRRSSAPCFSAGRRPTPSIRGRRRGRGPGGGPAHRTRARHQRVPGIPSWRVPGIRRPARRTAPVPRPRRPPLPDRPPLPPPAGARGPRRRPRGPREWLRPGRPQPQRPPPPRRPAGSRRSRPLRRPAPRVVVLSSRRAPLRRRRPGPLVLSVSSLRRPRRAPPRAARPCTGWSSPTSRWL